MSVTAVAAAGAALAVYLTRRRAAGGAFALCGADESGGVLLPADTHTTVHQAPSSFTENIFFLAEGLRYTYGETLARWRTADLLIGLAYLCRKDPEEHPVADIALQGRRFGVELSKEEWPAALAQLHELERFFRYCSGLRERRPVPQRAYFSNVLGITDDDLLVQELRAGVLKPSFVLVRDRELRSIVLAIRGTHSFKDMFTSLTGASKPHHLVDPNGVVLGYSHFGMLAAARWIKSEMKGRLEQALADNPGYRLHIIGHSLGGGTAALLTMMLREAGGPFADATCVAIACPSCMTMELAQSCSDYVTTVVHGADVVPTICPATADALREEMARSSWFREFRADVRSIRIVRAVETGLRGVSSATLSATSWTTSKLAACYQRGPFVRSRQQLKRRNSDNDLLATAGDAAAQQDEDEEGLPLSASAPTAASEPNLASAVAAEGRGGGAEGEPARRLQWSASASQWGQRVTTTAQSLKGRGAAVLSSSSGLLMSTSSGLLSRVWPGSTTGGAGANEPGGSDSPAAGDDSGSPFAAAAAAKGAAAAAPGPVGMDADEEGDDELEEAAAGIAAGEMGSFSLEKRHEMRVQLELERTGSLQEEVHMRMHEVEQAVHDAEEEEAAGQDDSTVPAVIRPGGYGAAGGVPASPSKQDSRWRRQMFPAGRIMHLVPARLVPGTAAYATAAAAAASEEQQAATGSASQPGSPPAATAAEAGAAAGEDAPAVIAGIGEAEHNSASTVHRRGKHAAKLSVSDLIAGEGLLGRHPSDAGASADACEGGDGGDCGEQQGAAAAGQQQPQQMEEMVLLDDVPQQSYSRIRLCRTVLSDHIIPNYLRALESALVGMRQQTGIDDSAEPAAAAGTSGDGGGGSSKLD